MSLGIVPARGEMGQFAELGLRFHTAHSEFADLPFGNGDLSYALAYEMLEEYLSLQIAMDYAPDVSGKTYSGPDDTTGIEVDYILTPQVNLLVLDPPWRMGFGIRTSYIRYSGDVESEWMDTYWQLQLGLNFPLSANVSMDACAYYVWERWSTFTKFHFRDLEYGMWLNCKF